MRTIYLLILVGLVTIVPAFSQQSTPPSQRIDRSGDISRYLQDLFPVQAEDIDYQSVYDALAQLYANPLDLNSASRDELETTYLLTERQLSSLATYRAEFGDLLSIYELQAVPDFDLPTIRRLLPFVTVAGTPGLFGTLPTPTDNYLIVRYERVLEQQKGFSEATPDKKGNLPSRYLGNAGQYYARYRYSRPRAFSIGLTLEKDPGEQIDWQPSTRHYGADYISFHAQIQNRGRWRNIILGDYQLQIGQGLVLSAGFVLGKSAETVQTIRRPSLGARPYTSLTEYGYFRGGTATYALHRTLDITLFAARNHRDANTAVDSSGLGIIATSLQTSGLHRTQSELDDQGSLLETNLGVHLLYHNRRQFQLGLTFLRTSFNKFFQKRDLPYNQYEFTGQQNLVVGLHGGYIWHNWNLFAEVAHSSGSATNSGGLGAVSGVLASLTKKLDMAIVLRHYDRNFHSFYSNGFSEGSRTINESGAYLGLKYTVYRKLTLGAFVDYFNFPWLKYLVDKPSDGFDYLLQARYTPNRQTAFYAVYHEEHKQKNLTIGKAKDVVGTTRWSYALNADYKLTRILSLRSRAQWGGFIYSGQSASRGFALIQDATLDYRRLSLSGRVALFGTDDYDSRQYVYERDVLYAFSFPAYFNRGIRHYLLAQYSLNRHLDVWVRWARTDLTNQNTVGSDLDQIDAPHKTEVKVQVRWRF
ncbi:helix-hairpin-helix domain-containing protein [Spirosoma sp. HMF4905]|uniref:Helix-hairpin-helix domain-containing protein n=1 Tax=Spirosoma arboris TaxID=2682092 RepID=A0A7K1S7F8_9BACT|nr:helix-hairpin-helix domain-containing protein [Spirosoma arboris]MVM29782.1 helix-hairpin-helix domain-containing protein [Spirosoma arboris]